MKDRKVQVQRVWEQLCQIGFSGDGAQQVRCLELLAKLLGMFDGAGDQSPAVIVEDM